MKKVVKAWAEIDEKGNIREFKFALCHYFLSVFSKKVIAGGPVIPCTITYTVPERKRKG